MRKTRAFAVGLGIVLAVAVPTAIAGGGKGTRSNPYRIHTLVTLPESKGWKMRVNKTIPNATSLVLAENQFNDRPKPGRQFLIVKVTLVYGGKGSSTPFEAGSFQAVGRSNVAYSESDDSCGVTPGEFDSFRKVFSGGRITGNICFSVRSSDVSSLLLFYEPLFSLNNTQIFFALR